MNIGLEERNAAAVTKTTTFSLKTPLLSAGNINNFLAETDLLRVWIKVYAEGGENFVHAHHAEDHAFIILGGEATFQDGEANKTVVKKWQGIMLPRGAYYSFASSGSEPLVLMRVGAGVLPGNRDDRKWPGGVVDTRIKTPPKVVQVPGKFFGDPEGE